ncbi:hypothetical protein EXW38_31090 (plasmid) [Bacillus mycoides]|uniref:hypothetical protein n=1 Tax=Bacillus mycoides TaxID=1405 RepID=UPI001C033C34|nr:hypothetical protein [Bacillus mycoides]QWH15623.1 hypothetical protein EXW38_31090 [Bacillus mycoides]
MMGMPFSGIANPKIFLASKPFGKEPDLYENENVEVIYLLRLMNAIFVLVCWKENKWTSSEEEDLARLLPHTILKKDQDSAVIVQAMEIIKYEFKQ